MIPYVYYAVLHIRVVCMHNTNLYVHLFLYSFTCIYSNRTVVSVSKVISSGETTTTGGGSALGLFRSGHVAVTSEVYGYIKVRCVYVCVHVLYLGMHMSQTLS